MAEIEIQLLGLGREREKKKSNGRLRATSGGDPSKSGLLRDREGRIDKEKRREGRREPTSLSARQRVSECAPVMLSSERKHSARPVQPPVTQPLSNPVTAPTPAQLVSDETASSISQKLDVGRERRCRIAGILLFAPFFFLLINVESKSPITRKE